MTSETVAASVRPNRHRGRRAVRIVIAIVGGLTLLVVAFLVYANTVMQGERPAALDAWENPGVAITTYDDAIVMQPTEAASGTGLVYIPGAKVDPYAYLGKLADSVTETGSTIVITKPTLNLAFFDFRPLSTFTDHVSGVADWYVGGHSLGGVKACLMATDEDIEGLVLFGSYCSNDLSGSELDVLSISASNDGLSTPDKIDDAAHLLPADATFTVLEGANHASFGDYGVQPGDGEATMSDAEVRSEIALALEQLWS